MHVRILYDAVPFFPARCGLPLFYRHTDMDSKVTFVMSGAVVGGGTGGAVAEVTPRASDAKGKKSGKKVRGCACLSLLQFVGRCSRLLIVRSVVLSVAICGIKHVLLILTCMVRSFAQKIFKQKLTISIK